MKIISCALLTAFMLLAQGGRAANQPNVVVFLADDQGWGDLSIHNNTQLETPHIDSIGRNGARMDRFYVCSVCAPTRAEFFTGRYHSRGGVRGVSSGQERLNLVERTIGDFFKAGGYVTGAFGKWHNGSQWPYHPNARGFDEYYGFTSGHWGEYFNPPLEHNGEPVRGKGFVADDFTDHAMTFIKKNKKRPFFCYLPFNTPHSPYAVPSKYWDRFKNKTISLRGGEKSPEDEDTTRCTLAMCENIDWNVGRVLRLLEELNLQENTIVIYFSDNGPNTARWNGGMKGIKASVEEGGLRVPFLIRWPGKIKPGTVIPQIAGAIDLLPTLTTLCGVPLSSSRALDGRDLSPLLLGQGKEWPDRQIFSHQGGRVSVRTQRFRLDPLGVLYDMEGDPGQKQDVSSDHPAIALELKESVKVWKQEVLSPMGKEDRPFPVGYPEFPRTPLPARDGEPHGGIKRSTRAPNCSYFVNWTQPDDFITWDIEVANSGNYEVVIDYTAPKEGSVVELSFQGHSLSGKVKRAWDPPLYTNQDTIPRPPIESTMKEFRKMNLGRIRLKKGRGLLKLQAKEIVGNTVMDVRQVTLTLVPEQGL